jgi:hypothetical protein
MDNQTIVSYAGRYNHGVEVISDTNPHVTVGISQVETIECTAGESTGAGDITMTITSAGMAGSPLAVTVPVAESDSIADVVAAVKLALNAQSAITDKFTVGGTSPYVTLTETVPAANDATLAFGFVDTDSTGVTFGASTNTTAGVVPDSSIKDGACYHELQVIVAATFTLMTPRAGYNVVGTLTGREYPVGTILKGLFTQLTLSGGTVLAHLTK